MERLVLFVCTGNVCRSPMAEYLLRTRLDGSSGWCVTSAGVVAGAGMSASAPAVHVMQEIGIDMTSHRSRSLTVELVDSATLIVVMTMAHRDQIRVFFPNALQKVFLLKSFSGSNGDIDDPIGSSVSCYRAVRNEIDNAMPDLIGFMKELE
ncbi:MAG: low molecular weight protein arginine phosphatase [Lentisphaerae bacterium]|nr:low molecular weight protein arginine phosphatase [Lentisphaerota bacterium]